MKILFLITKSSEGGAQTHIFQLSRALLGKGHRVAVMSAPGGWLEKEITALGGTFFANPDFRNSYNIFRAGTIRRRIRKALDEFNPDIVSCHSGFAGFFGRLAIRGRVPTVFTAHGWSFAPGGRLHQRLLTVVAERYAARFCSRIICVSEYDRRLALRFRIARAEKIVTIHNGVEIPDTPPAAKSAVHAITFIGRLTHQKRPIVLLSALASLPARVRSELSVTLIGDGPDMAELASFVRRNDLSSFVHFRGALSRPEVLSVLQKTDLFILPTRREGLPRSILEAFSCGVPVIASDVGGISEMVAKGTGFLLPEKKPEQALAKYIELLHDDPRLLATLGAGAFERVRTEFSLDTMIGKTIAVYDSLLTR